MIKKYFFDILSIFLVALVIFLTVKRPAVDLDLPPSFSEGKESLDARKEDPVKVKKLELTRAPVAYNSLKERNIFAADGIYLTQMDGRDHKGPLPGKPYTLIGILQGEEKRAVFREHTGAIITLTVGKRLMDGSMITRIDELSVELEKGKEKRELKIFEFKPPKPLTLKKP